MFAGIEPASEVRDWGADTATFMLSLFLDPHWRTVSMSLPRNAPRGQEGGRWSTLPDAYEMAEDPDGFPFPTLEQFPDIGSLCQLAGLSGVHWGRLDVGQMEL